MENRKPNKPLAIISLCLFSYWLIRNISDHCHTLSTGDCGFLWILSAGSILGGMWINKILLTELVGQRRNKTKDEVLVKNKKNPIPNVWQRAVIRITLSSILLSLPSIFQGAFISTFSGLVIGALLAALVNKPPMTT